MEQKEIIEGILENYEIVGYTADESGRVNKAKLFIKSEVDGELSDRVVEVFSMTTLTEETLRKAKGGYVLYQEQPNKNFTGIRQGIAFEGTPLYIRGISCVDKRELNSKYNAKFLTEIFEIDTLDF